MPTHVHVMVQIGDRHPRARVVESWKSYSAKEINRLQGRTGRLWQGDYWDRYIRDERHFVAAMEYLQENPVKAGVVARAWMWRWSSAYRDHGDDAAKLAADPGRPSWPHSPHSPES